MNNEAVASQILSDIIVDWVSQCPVCDKARTYITKQGWLKGQTKPCRSCANSISKGGLGNIGVNEDGNKRCCVCLEWLSVENYYVYADSRIHSSCNECKKASFREWQKTSGRFRNHNITQAEYILLYEEQNGKCAICLCLKEVLCIDHNHDTGEIRGLLCGNCNTGIGLLQDSPAVLIEAVRYLNG